MGLKKTKTLSRLILILTKRFQEAGDPSRRYPHNLFAKTNGVYLVGEDDKIITANEVDCLIACIEERDFVCHSVDLKEADQRCVLSRKDISMDGVSVQTDSSYVHWKRLIDSTNPSIEGCPYDLTRSTITGTNYTTVQWEPPVFQDSSEITSIIQNHSPGDRFYIGSTIVSYTATDAFDNSATCTFTVIIKDTEKPVLSRCPESINYVIPDYYTSEQTEDISWEPPSCMDNSYRYNLTASQEPGSIFYKGVTDVSYTCSDASSNVQKCIFTVNVKTTDELSKIDISIELLNVAYSDALANQDSEQFHALEHDIVSVIDDLYKDEENFVSSVVNMFSSGSVLTNLLLTFFDNVDAEMERYYLDILLQQTVTGELGDFIVGDVLVLGGNGEYVTLDACYTLPCPDEMVCQASGLNCNAVCEDNADYCLNDARCVAEGNLIGCTCSSSDYYGARCQIIDKWSQAEIAAVIFGGLWGVILVTLLFLFVTCKCIERIQQPKAHNSTESVLIEKTNYAIENKAYIVDPSADLPEAIDGIDENAVSEVDGSAMYDNNEDDLDERKDTYHYTGSMEDYKMDSISGSGNQTPSISDSVHKAPSITDSAPSTSRSGSREPSTSDFASRSQSIPGSNRTPSVSGSASQAPSTLSGSTSRVQLIS
ncbi:uncharacterized protein LOC117125370 [Anneissia japonica]|uniref:uncharacterized protein LOC117125370 n=1 Tax=Anneissia japonica TaxID=1529436 RepID=UPI0014257BC4|nr:uncharacterized protein LOC117125370 [Anneissia japonica]